MPSLAVTTPLVPCDARVAPTSAHLLKKLARASTAKPRGRLNGPHLSSPAGGGAVALAALRRSGALRETMDLDLTPLTRSSEGERGARGRCVAAWGGVERQTSRGR